MTAKAAIQAGLASVALPRTFTTTEAREIVTKAFQDFGRKKLPSLIGVEMVEVPILDATTTERTILSIAVTALNAAGIPTQKTVGDARGKLGMTPDDIDQAFCICVNGAEMSGDAAAARMGGLN